jgi:hypothetical protein
VADAIRDQLAAERSSVTVPVGEAERLERVADRLAG